MKKTESWYGRHLNVGYEVTRHSISEYNPNGIFCGYLRFDSVAHPEILQLRGSCKWVERYKPELPKYEQHDHNTFFDRFDWNGGITFYEETVTIGGMIRMKIGHDYAHIWDKEGRADEQYDAEHIEFRLKKIIDQYREVYPYVEEPK